MNGRPNARRALAALALAVAAGVAAPLLGGARRALCACGGPAVYDVAAPSLAHKQHRTKTTEFTPEPSSFVTSR